MTNIENEKLKKMKTKLIKLKKEIAEMKWNSDPIGQFLDYCNGKITDEEIPESKEEHGGLVKVVQEAYGDRKIYKDGYEEWESIGD